MRDGAGERRLLSSSSPKTYTFATVCVNALAQLPCLAVSLYRALYSQRIHT